MKDKRTKKAGKSKFVSLKEMLLYNYDCKDQSLKRQY